MNKKQAEQSFVYHGDRIYSPLGKYSKYHDYMRTIWSWVVDNKLYSLLPNDAVEADEAARAMYEGKTSKSIEEFMGIE